MVFLGGNKVPFDGLFALFILLLPAKGMADLLTDIHIVYSDITGDDLGMVLTPDIA